MGQGDSINAQNAPHRAEIRDESLKSQSLQIALHLRSKLYRAADNFFELREHPGYGLRSPGQNSESVEAEEETFKDSLKMSIVSISGHSLYKGLF
jgi:hypothetical protein